MDFLSVGHLIEKGFRVFFEDHPPQISDTTGNVMLRVKTRGRSFSFDPRERATSLFHEGKCNRNLAQQICHCHLQALLLLKKEDMKRRLPTLVDHIPSCHAFSFGMQNRKSFTKETWRTSQRLQMIPIDVEGPQRTLPLYGSLYYVILIENYTRFFWIFFMKYK